MWELVGHLVAGSGHALSQDLRMRISSVQAEALERALTALGSGECSRVDIETCMANFDLLTSSRPDRTNCRGAIMHSILENSNRLGYRASQYVT
jgi:hypothetical protein